MVTLALPARRGHSYCLARMLIRYSVPWMEYHLCNYSRLTTTQSIDSETQSGDGQEVLVTRRTPSSLALATHHLSTVSFTTPLRPGGSPKAILLRPKFTHIGLGLIAMVVLTAIAAPGVLLGVVVGEAELGITLSATIAGTFALAGKLRGGHAR